MCRLRPLFTHRTFDFPQSKLSQLVTSRSYLKCSFTSSKFVLDCTVESELFEALGEDAILCAIKQPEFKGELGYYKCKEKILN